MTASSIRHSRKGRFYRAPVLLDQRSMLRIGLAMSLFLVIIFMSGYVTGFQKAEDRLTAPIASFALELPEPVASSDEEIEPKRPLHVEPGENIDVDSVDESELAQLSGSSDTAIEIKHPVAGVQKRTAAVENSVIETADDTQQAMAPALELGIGGPAESDPGQIDASATTVLSSNTTEDKARFSIQVGMFSRVDNAERRVNELISEQLDAYFDESLNARNEIRYHVRFGYFSDHRSAREALKAYQQETGGSGYIINLQTTLASR